VFAYLWTPAELIRLDFVSMLVVGGRRRPRRSLASTRPSAILLPALARQQGRVVDIIEGIIAKARGVEPHNTADARAFIVWLEDRAAKLRGRWPGWVYCRAATCVAHRLLPHRVEPSPGQPLPWAIRARAAQLRGSAGLVIYRHPVIDHLDFRVTGVSVGGDEGSAYG
jgi:hypothetical protein